MGKSHATTSPMALGFCDAGVLLQGLSVWGPTFQDFSICVMLRPEMLVKAETARRKCFFSTSWFLLQKKQGQKNSNYKHLSQIGVLFILHLFFV